MMMMTIVCVYSRWTRIRNWPFSLSFFLDFTSPIFSRFSHCPSSLVLLLYECGQRVIKYTCVHVCGQSKLGRHDPLLRLDRYVLILSLSLALMSLNIGYCMLIDLMCPDWCSLSFRFRDQMTAEYIPMSWKREREREKKHYRMDDRQHHVLTFFSFRSVKKKKRIRSRWSEKINSRENDQLNSSVFLYRKILSNTWQCNERCISFFNLSEIFQQIK